MLVTTLIPRVQLQSTAIPSNMASFYLNESARRFFRKTAVWTTDLTFDSVAEQAAYALDLSGEVSAGTTPKVLRIQRVKYNGATIHPTGYYLRESDDYLVFNSDYIPDDSITDGLVVTVSIVPASDGTDYPSSLLGRYIDGIVGGALYYLLRIPSRPYTDLGASARYKIDMDRDIVRARMDIGSEGTERAGGLRESSQNTGGVFG